MRYQIFPMVLRDAGQVDPQVLPGRRDAAREGDTDQGLEEGADHVEHSSTASMTDDGRPFATTPTTARASRKACGHGAAWMLELKTKL